MGHIGDPHRVLVVHRIQTGPLTGFLLQRVNPDGQLGRSVGVLSASASSSARRRFWRSEVRSRSLRARYWTRVGSRDEVKQRPKPHVNLSRRVPMSERLAFRPTEAGRVTPMDNRPLPTEVPERGTHLHGDLPMRGDVIVRANPRAVPRVDDGWRSARVGVRTGWPPGVVLPDLVAVVAHGRVATSQLQQQLSERRLGVALVIDGDLLDVGVADAVTCAGTYPRVGVVVVQSPAADRDAVESALSHVQGPSAPVAVMDGSAGGHGDPMAHRPMHASTLVGLADLALLVVSQPQLAGRQVAFITNSLLLGHVDVNQEFDEAGLFGPDLTQHAEQRSKSLSPGTRMRGAVTALDSDVGPQALLDVLTTIGERGVDAVVLALDPTPFLGQRDIDGVLRSLNGAIPHAVIVNVDSHPRSPNAPVPVFASDA